MSAVAAIPALEIDDLSVTFGHGAKAVTAVRRVSIDVPVGHTVGLVGESGSGKSTIAKAAVGIVTPSAGRILLGGVDLGTLGHGDQAVARRRLQLIPQDPYSSLSPRRTIGETMAEALDPVRASVGRHRDRIVHWLEAVKLDADSLVRYPHEFSGGQRQRVAIARALAVEPQVVIADEITSALDVSVQAEILALLVQLREELDLTMLFISHNLAVVRQVCDRTAVLYRGDLVESGDTVAMFADPQHDYTRTLLAAVPGSALMTLDQPSSRDR
ncbi:ABC transporter ATP-binding protein [Nocardioides sp. LHG3406-4]|uniref:ABC transporter ATP-binding protein n=1 Tax=Nocardioides sp. LHG3406-4 TaxID=2804575 RepID=UPI003CF34E96